MFGLHIYTFTQQCDADGGEIRFITTEETLRNVNGTKITIYV